MSTCKNCGAKNLDIARFCSKCGDKIGNWTDEREEKIQELKRERKNLLVSLNETQSKCKTLEEEKKKLKAKNKKLIRRLIIPTIVKIIIVLYTLLFVLICVVVDGRSLSNYFEPIKKLLGCPAWESSVEEYNTITITEEEVAAEEVAVEEIEQPKEDSTNYHGIDKRTGVPINKIKDKDGW